MYRALYRSSVLIGMLYSCTSFAATFPDTLSRPATAVRPVTVHLCYGESFRGRHFYGDTLFTEITINAAGAAQRQLFDVHVAFSGDESYVDGPATLCQNQPVEISVSQEFAGFHWDDGSSDRSRTVQSAGTYRVTVTDATGCSKELNHTVTESSLRISSADAVRPLCPGDNSGSLSVTARGGGPLLYALEGAGGYQHTGQFDSLAAGNYTVHVQDPEGCADRRDVTVPAASPLHLFDPAHRTGTAYPGQRLPLPTAPNFTPSRVRWRSAAQLDCGDCLAPTVAAAADETFVVEATTPAGCAVRDSFSLSVSEAQPVFSPGAFTPNDDGHNDRWQLYAADGVDAIGDLSISDENGKVCHRQNRALSPTDPRLRWDGTYLGRSAETGAYRYAATLHLLDGTQTRITGTLRLTR